MSAINPSKQEQDLITGARRQFKRKLNKWGQYLERGEWAGTFRAWNVEHDDNSKDAEGVGRDGIIEFKQLANGNLKAHIEWNHAVDDTPQSADYIIALDPDNRTFTGLGYLAGFEETARATGYFEPKRGLLNVIDIGPSQGSLTGGTFIRTWDFVDIG
jgi:hypothetical protein